MSTHKQKPIKEIIAVIDLPHFKSRTILVTDCQWDIEVMADGSKYVKGQIEGRLSQEEKGL